MNTGIKKYIFFLMILTIFVMSCTVLVFAEEYLDTISLKGKKSIVVINNTSGEVSIQDTYDTTVRTEAGIKYNKEFKSENENLKVQAAKEEVMREVELEAGKTIEFINDINEDIRVEVTGKVDYARYNSDGTLYDYRVNDSGYITFFKGKRIVITNKETEPIIIRSGRESFIFEAQPKEEEAIRRVEVEVGNSIEFVNNSGGTMQISSTDYYDYEVYNNENGLVNSGNTRYSTSINNSNKCIVTNSGTEPITIYSGSEVFKLSTDQEQEIVYKMTYEGKDIYLFGADSESIDDMYAIVADESDIQGKTWDYTNIGGWSETSFYATIPSDGGIIAGIVAAKSEVKSLELSRSIIPDKIISIIEIDLDDIEQKIRSKMIEYTGIDFTQLSSEDLEMLGLGIVDSVDDNVFFGLAKKIANREGYSDNYYYIRAKAFGDACFVSAYTIATVGSATQAVIAFTNSGISGTLAVATSPSGAGGAALGAVAVEELARGTVLTGVSFVSSKMMERSHNALTESVANLKETIGYKLRNIADDILDQMEAAGGHTLEKHVSKTNNELINRAVNEGIDATSFANKSTATKSVQQNLRNNASEIEKWLDNSSNNGYLIVDYNHMNVIGSGAKAGSQHITNGLTKSRIFMVKDSSQSLGFKIITSYPIF
ncbi:MAG: hypothetical protein MJA31_07810 [Clostridia bacterium]|nr:hypothetical protein [Clostridia bacterium]